MVSSSFFFTSMWMKLLPNRLQHCSRLMASRHRPRDLVIKPLLRISAAADAHCRVNATKAHALSKIDQIYSCRRVCTNSQTALAVRRCWIHCFQHSRQHPSILRPTSDLY